MSAYETLKQQVDAAAAALLRAKTALDAATSAAEKDETEVKKLADALKAAEREATRSGRALETWSRGINEGASKARELFAKGFGGGEFAEKLRDVASGFGIVGDGAQAAGTRITAFAGTLGIAVRAGVALAQQAVRLGDALADYSRRAHHAAETDLSQAWENTKRSADSLAQSTFRLAEGLGRAAVHGDIGSRMNSEAIDKVVSAFNSWADSLESRTGTGVVRALKNTHDATAALQGKWADFERATPGFVDNLRAVKNELMQLSFAARAGETAGEGFMRMLGATEAAAIQASITRRNQRAIRESLLGTLRATGGRLGGVGGITAEDIRGVTGGGGGGGGGSHRDPWAAYNAAVRSYEDAARNTEAFRQGTQAMRDEADQRYRNQLAARGYYTPEAERQRAAGDRAAMAAADRQSNVIQGRFNRRFDFGAQLGDVAQRFIPESVRTKTAAEQMAETVSGAFGKMTSAAEAFFGAIIAGQDAGAALKAFAHEVTKALAQEAAVKAIFNLAQGFAALASYQYPQAVSAFTAAGLYTAVAAGAGLVAAVTAPSQAGAAAGAGGAPPSQARSGGSDRGRDAGGGGNVTVINVDGHIYGAGRETFEDVVERARRGARRRGIMDRAA